MGFHKPVFGRTMLGGTVHRVMTGVEADVGVFVDRGLSDVAHGCSFRTWAIGTTAWRCAWPRASLAARRRR